MKNVILLGNDHTNTLGLAQVLGKSGFHITAYVWGNKTGLLKVSKYVKYIYSAKDEQSCIDQMIKTSMGGGKYCYCCL